MKVKLKSRSQSSRALHKDCKYQNCGGKNSTQSVQSCIKFGCTAKGLFSLLYTFAEIEVMSFTLRVNLNARIYFSTQGCTTFINDILSLRSTFCSCYQDCSPTRLHIPSIAYSILHNFMYSAYCFCLHSFDIYSLFVRDEILSHILIHIGINLTLVCNSVFVWFLVIFETPFFWSDDGQ